jgi:hypothetical protein
MEATKTLSLSLLTIKLELHEGPTHYVRYAEKDSNRTTPISKSGWLKSSVTNFNRKREIHQENNLEKLSAGPGRSAHRLGERRLYRRPPNLRGLGFPRKNSHPDCGSEPRLRQGYVLSSTSRWRHQIPASAAYYRWGAPPEILVDSLRALEPPGLPLSSLPLYASLLPPVGRTYEN